MRLDFGAISPEEPEGEAGARSRERALGAGVQAGVVGPAAPGLGRGRMWAPPSGTRSKRKADSEDEEPLSSL